MSAQSAIHMTSAQASNVVALRPQVALTHQRGTRLVDLKPKYGGASSQVEVRYLWAGAAHAPTVVVQGGISADRDVFTLDGQPGWWQELVGEGRAIDLRHCRVLCIDWLVPGDFGGQALGSVSTEDQADALAAVMTELGIEAVEAFVGYSFGAMTGLAFAKRHPSRLGQLLMFSGAHRAHPMATAQRSIQRQIVRMGLASGQSELALSLARQLAMTTYRGSEEFSRRFAAAPEFRDGRFQFPVEDYLNHVGQKFVERFDVERFLALSEAIDLHDVDPGAIQLPVTLIGVASDRLVPLADLCELQRSLRGATLEVIDSPYGHDASLKEVAKVAPLLRQALNCCCGV
ncbi:homoserine O-succinyltransferase MetX [Frateuria aurantia]